ncbi:zinc finger, CCHC-type containing protein [Tanacetum coccineum]
MGDKNSIRTLGDYSKPYHEGYSNTIKLPVGNNMVPFRSDTIQLVQNGCSFHELRSEDPNQHIKDFLKLVDSLDLDGDNRTAKLHNDIRMFQQHHRESLSEAWTRFKDLLRKVPHHGLNLWLQIQIYYDHIDGTTQRCIDYASGGRLRKLSPAEAWAIIERQLLGIMKHKVDTLMKDAISLMKESESVFQLATNEFEDYMQAIMDEFMEFSSEVTQRLKERIREEEEKPKKIIKITRYPDTEVLEKSVMHDFLENPKKKTFPNPSNLLCVKYVRIIPLNSPQPRKNTFGFNPRSKTNQSHHKPTNSLTVQPLAQSKPTFVNYDPIKRDPSPHYSFTHVISNHVFDPGGRTHDLSFKGKYRLQLRNF